jgi:hypothetical protein
MLNLYYQSSSLKTATEYKKIKPLLNAHMGLAYYKGLQVLYGGRSG